MSEPEAQAAVEETESALEEVGVRTMDEIVLPGDGPPEEEAQEEPAPAVEEVATEPAAEAAEGETEEGEEAPSSVLETVRAKLEEQAGGSAEAASQDARDLELAQLRQQAILREQEEKKALQKRLDDLEASVSGKTEEPTGAEDTARIQAAAKFYEEKFNLEPQEALDMATTTAEQARIEAELKLKEGLAPFEEKWAKAEEYQQQQATIQQSTQGLAKGVANLARSGGTELELAEDFQQNGFNSLLGRTLGTLAGNDAAKLTEILAHERSDLFVEQAGAALARRAEAYAKGESDTAPVTGTTGSTGLAAKASPRSKGATKPKPKASPGEAIAAELDANLGGAEAAFPFLGADFEWGAS